MIGVCNPIGEFSEQRRCLLFEKKPIKMCIMECDKFSKHS